MSTKKNENMVRCSTDYDRFVANEFNRPLHDDALLEASMRAHGFKKCYHLTCHRRSDGKIEILHGHHRFRTAKRLGLPIWYMLDNEPLCIYEVEASSKSRWSSEDFATAYARAGHPEYRALLAFRKTNRLPLCSAATLLAGQTADTSGLWLIKSGEFKRGDPKHANEVISVLDACDKCGLDFSRSSSFVKAVSHALRIPEFSIDRLLHVINDVGGGLKKRATYEDYLDEIEALYNRGIRAARHMAIRLRAHEVGLARKASFGRESGAVIDKATKEAAK